MFFSRSLLASATLLSLSGPAQAWVLHRKSEEQSEVKRLAADGTPRAWSWNGLFAKRQDDVILDCPDNQFAALLDSNPDDRVASFCNDWLNIAPATVVSEVTPTITFTTSASLTTTQTSIERVWATTTVTETETITPTPDVRRRMVAAAAAQVQSIAASIVSSVIASGTPSTEVATSSKPANRILAEQGLATACSCKMVQPTATVTDYFTVNPVSTTVGVRVIRVIKETETRTFTSTTSVLDSDISTETPAPSSTAAAASSTEVISSLADAVGVSSRDEVNSSSSSPVITTAPVVPTSVASGNSTSTEGVPVVTAIPFSCDEDDVNKNVDQVVGGIRLGYSVFCNTEVVTGDRINNFSGVGSPTTCAAQCSLLNAKSGQDTCQSAVFTPYTDGRRGGDCDLFSAGDSTSVETSPAPGSVAIIHTGTFANGNECAALNATSSSIDTSALVASITSAGVIISTPGLVTQSSGGGVSRTFVSANSTDASGYVHWSWYELYASSASWWAVYETSWACSATITRTIQQPATTIIDGAVITSIIATTIVGNGYTTIYSGDFTTTFRGGGGGAGGSSFVPASTTEGEAGVTTFFSTASQTSTGTDGIVTPTPTPSTVGGEGNVTVIEVFSTFFSTGTAGVISPSASASLNSSASAETIVSSTATTLTISGANSTFLSTGTDGVIAPSTTPVVEVIVSSGATTLTLSGADATSASTGGNGVVPPPSSASESASTSESASSSSSSEEWDEPGFYGPRTSTLVVASSSVLTVTSTGLSGVETPTVITAISSETVVVVITNTTLSGNASVATSTSVATFNSTGSNGIITPTPFIDITTTAAGTANFTITVGTITANSTGGGGVIPPASTGTLSFPEDFGSREGGFTRSRSTGTANSTGASGFATPSSNLTTVIETPSANTTFVLTVPLSTGFTSTFEIPVVNSSVTVTTPPSATSPPTFNTTTSIPEEEGSRSGSFSRSHSSSIPVNGTSSLSLPVSTGSTTTEIPPVNSTTSVTETTPPPEMSSFSTGSGSTLVVTVVTNITLSLPSTSISVVTLIPPTTRPFDNTTSLPTPTGSSTSVSLVSIDYSTVSSFSTGNLSTILPPTTPTSNTTIVVETPSISLNSTTAPPSVTIPPLSLNSSLSLSTSSLTFTETENSRQGSITRSIPLSTGITTSSNLTTTPPPFPTGNSTVPVGPTAPVNSTTEACPSPTEFSFITREVIITTFTVETVPVVASTCISSAAFPTAVNGSFPTGGNATLPTDAISLPSVVESLASAVESLTATDAAPTSSDVPPVISDILSIVSSVASEVAASPTAAPVSRFRRSGTLATQEQIEAACADDGNLVLSPELNIQPDDSTEGWFVGPSENTIIVSSVTTDNGTIAQFRSAFPGRTLSLVQPLTLCPGTQYDLSALTEQRNRNSGCTVQLRIGNDSVFTATPGTTWTTQTASFTAGPGPEGASVDLQLVGSCAGFFGAPVGADVNGFMIVEVGAVSVTAE